MNERNRSQSPKADASKRLGRLTPSEIESLRKESQEAAAWMQAELERLEPEEKATVDRHWRQ